MEDSQYIQEIAHPIFEHLMMHLLVEKPDNIVDAMIEWLEDRRDNGINKEKVKANNKIQKNKQENRNYISTRIHPIFEKVVIDLLLDKPDDIIEFLIEWLNEKGQMFSNDSNNIQNGGQISLNNVKNKKKPKNEEMPSSESDDEDEDAMDEIPLEVLQKKGKEGMRSSVSAEAYGNFNQKAQFKPRNIPKNQDQKDRIIKKLTQSFMFSSLNEKDKNIVIGAMEEKKFKPGDWVIKQGEDGNDLYVVDSGELDCFKKFNDSDEPKFLKTYHPGESFGELALLYNAPRQASIRAKTDAILWCLDRDTFNNIVKDSAQKKREEHEKFLSKIDLLADLSQYERTQVSDSLQQVNCKKGEYVVRQGDQGDMFFMVESGELVALKVTQPGAEPIEVMQYKPGDYFGELALMGDQPRAASILCKTDCILVALDRYSFKRLLGPVDDILKRNAEKYQKMQESESK